MKKIIVYFVFLFSILSVESYSQSIELWTISSAGSNSSQSKCTLDWTLGEPFASTIRTAKNQVYTEGFHQPYVNPFFLVPQTVAGKNQIECTIYPNPASSTLIIKPNANIPAPMEYKLLSFTGQQITGGELEENTTTEIDVSNFLPGTYWLQIGIKGQSNDIGKLTIHQIVLH